MTVKPEKQKQEKVKISLYTSDAKLKDIHCYLLSFRLDLKAESKVHLPPLGFETISKQFRQIQFEAPSGAILDIDGSCLQEQSRVEVAALLADLCSRRLMPWVAIAVPDRHVARIVRSIQRRGEAGNLEIGDLVIYQCLQETESWLWKT